MENELKPKDQVEPQQPGELPTHSLTGGVNNSADIQVQLADQANAIQDLIKKAKDTEKVVDRTQTIVFLGFIILLLMALGIAVTYFQQMNLTYGNLLEKINSLK